MIIPKDHLNTTLICEFKGSGNFKLRYDWNPFEQKNQPVRFDEGRFVIRRDASGLLVPHKKGVLLVKGSLGIIIYKGEFIEGFRHGEGFAPIYEFGNYVGDYTGQWYLGMRHGYGILKYPNGTTYKGQWFHDEKCGVGVEEESIGSKYVGVWNQGVRQGSGRYFWGMQKKKIENRCYENGVLISKNPFEEQWPEIDEIEKRIEKEFKNRIVMESKIAIETSLSETTEKDKPQPGPFQGLTAKKC